MNDNQIECSSFEDLGVPSPLECWKQQAHLLACEVGDLQKALSNARLSNHQLVIMHAEAAKHRDALSLEVMELKWKLGDKLRNRNAAIHDRKPLVLAPEHAREWIDPDTSSERAAEIAVECCRPVAKLRWY